MANVVDKLIAKVDKIRQRVNVDKVGVRRYRLYRVIRTWSGTEVNDGSPTYDVQEILPAPAIELGDERDALNGRGRVDVGSMRATEVSLTYNENFLQGYPLSAVQECYYRLVEKNVSQGADTTYWILTSKPKADRCETVSGNIQWIMDFRRYEVSE